MSSESDLNRRLDTLGSRMRYARKKKGLLQREVADEIGVSERQVNRYEADDARPRRRTMQLIADLLEVEVGWLLGRVSATFTLGASGSVSLTVAPPLDDAVVETWKGMLNSDDETVILNVRVPAAFREWLRSEASARGVSIREIAMLGFAFVRENYVGQRTD